GFDPEEFWPVDKAEAREAIGVNPAEPVLLPLGRMGARQGVETVIRALGRVVRDHGIAPRLLIVGGESDEPDPMITPEIGRLLGVVAEEGAGVRVSLVGRRGRDKLRDYYSAADMFISTPWYEPFGITPVEAMA